MTLSLIMDRAGHLWGCQRARLMDPSLKIQALTRLLSPVRSMPGHGSWQTTAAKICESFLLRRSPSRATDFQFIPGWHGIGLKTNRDSGVMSTRPASSFLAAVPLVLAKCFATLDSRMLSVLLLFGAGTASTK